MPTGHLAPSTAFLRRLVLALVLALGCGPTGDRGNRTDAVVARWHGVVDLAIGSLEGSHDQFGEPSGAAVGRDGRIYLADLQYNSIRVFDPTGHYVFSVGRPGSGPGELSGSCCLAFDTAGDLWVRDARNGRYNRYRIQDTTARFMEQRLMSNAARGYVVPITFDRDGRLVDVGLGESATGVTTVLRVHRDSTGRVVSVDSIVGPPLDSLGQHLIPSGPGMIVFLQQPYGPRHLVGHAPGGGWASAVSSRYLVHWVVDGDTAGTRTVRRDLIGPALSARERAVAESTLTANASGIGLTGAAVPFGVPGAKPLLAALMFDVAGHLWVQMSVADGELNRADVYDTSGHRIAMAEWPTDVDLRDGLLLDHVAFGVREDSAGVSQVVRVRFR
ncbi:MAG: hypothetical protein ABI836_09540 [Gemmatimonadota bacterium]